MKAFDKYGHENFKREILEFCDSIEHALKREAFYVDEDWVNYLTENNNNQYLIKIMQQTDNDLYKRQKAKIELENHSLKRIIISGGFWFGIFIGLGYFLLQLASSDISWYRFLA